MTGVLMRPVSSRIEPTPSVNTRRRMETLRGQACGDRPLDHAEGPVESRDDDLVVAGNAPTAIRCASVPGGMHRDAQGVPSPK